MIKAISKVAPGTELREAIDHIINARTGALICIGDTENILKLANGGFELYHQFTPQRLYELSKMDGAIILDDDLNQILRSNVHLVPDSSLYTSESGMRHRTAERIAKQTNALVISVSQRRNTVTVYLGNSKYILRSVKELLSQSNQALSALEKYKSRLDQVAANLNALEYEDLVTLLDVLIVLQRSLMVEKVSDEIRTYVSELGAEGRLIQMQLDELAVNTPEESQFLVLDYAAEEADPKEVYDKLKALSSEDILDLMKLAEALGYDSGVGTLDTQLHPKGYRVLRKVPKLPFTCIDKIVQHFSNLQSILNAKAEQLSKVEGVGKSRAQMVESSLRRFKESSLMERYV